MKTIKPQKLGLLTRCYEFQRRYYLGVSVLAFVPLGTVPSLFSEVSLWTFVPDALGKDAALDAAIPKVGAEFLVTGRAFAPGGEPVSHCLVRARVGPREKTLAVFGDRYWQGVSATRPQPFAEMPLDWAHAFGGAGFPKNPVGKGIAPVAVGQHTLQPLPNIEYPDRRVGLPNDRPEPAGFGPLDLTWPQRFSKAGTYKKEWLEKESPGFAGDIDWRFFNLTSSDQQLEEAFRGDEPYLFENMHPEKPLLEGRFPGIGARCFVNRQGEAGESFEEVAMRLTTAWFFPDAERAVLIFHGTTRLLEEDGADILHMLIGAEHLGRPKGADYYRELLKQRLDKDKGPLLALRDGDLLPEDLQLTTPAQESKKSLAASEGLLRQNLRRRTARELDRAREKVVSYGLDPEFHAPSQLPEEEPLPDLENLPEYLEKIKAEAARHEKEQKEREAQRNREVEKLFNDLGMDYQALQAEMTATPVGPPKYTADGQVRELRELAERLKKEGAPTGELEEMLVDPEKVTLWRQSEKMRFDNYRLTAHHQNPAPALDGDAARNLRDAVFAAHNRGESLAGRDLTGADLSRMDLQGADLEGAFLESANLEESNLHGANLKNAVLAHASLQGARLTNTVLEGVNLGKAKLKAAQADGGTDLRGARLVDADLSGAVLRGALCEGADFSGATLAGADFSGARAAGVTFLENDLRGVNFNAAQLDKACFLKADARDVDFSGASMKEIVFLAVKGQGSRFRGADMTNARFVEKCLFDGADFTQGRLEQANLRGTSLIESQFHSALLRGADLSECDLRKASLYRAAAQNALFVKTNLSGAVMTSINLMNAILQRANLCGADLRGSNFFQADVSRILRDTETQFGEAFAPRVRVHPKRSS